MTVVHIAARELRAYFTTVIGWAVLSMVLLLSGWLWIDGLTRYVTAGVEMGANPYSYDQMNLSDWLVAPYLGTMAFLLLMFVPALSMRTFSDELKSKSIELLLTSPIGTAEIVLGKFFGAMAFVGVMLACTGYVPLSLWAWGSPDWGVLAAGYGAVLATAAAVISMGMLASSLTEHQIVALVLGVGGALAAWILQVFGGPLDKLLGALVSWVGDATGTSLPKPSEIIEALSIGWHLNNMISGSVWASDLVFFLGFTGFFLFATAVRVDSYRWR